MLNKNMKLAIELAKKAKDDIPVGAIIFKNGKILARAANKREEENRTVAHAEILAIEEANKKLDSWRLDGCEMFVTLEPCPMCAWAIINSRIEKLYFGSWDLKYGAFGGALNLLKLSNSKLQVIGGVLENECTELVKKYFENLRNEK